LANKYQKKLGYFLLEIDTTKPSKSMKPKFIVRWTNKLLISDASLNIIHIERENLNGQMEKKVEMVVSYKTIHVNQYVIFLVEIKTSLINFWFEMY